MPINPSKISPYYRDYPTDSSKLSYQWTCKEISPNYAAACPTALSGSTSVTASIAANAFARSADATYEISLFVKYANPSPGNEGVSARSSIEVAMVSTSIPEINFASPAAKFNPDEKAIISCAMKTIGA